MRQRHYTTEGIVLGRKNYSEADRLLVIFTKDFGKLSYIAKGIRKPKSRKRGSLEVFNQVKFAAASGHGIDMLTEAEIIETFTSLRKSLKKVSVAYFFVETIGKITRDGERNEQLYNLLVDYMGQLRQASKLRKLRTAFSKDVLVLLGFWRHDQDLVDPDNTLENVVEKKLYSIRIGRKMI